MKKKKSHSYSENRPNVDELTNELSMQVKVRGGLSKKYVDRISKLNNDSASKIKSALHNQNGVG